MPVTNFAGEQFRRSAERTTAPVGWFDSTLKDVFALTSVEELPGGHLDVNQVAFTTSKSRVTAWVARAELPIRHTAATRPILTLEHIFPEQN